MDQQYSDTIRHLIDSYQKLTPQLQKAARYMVENPEEVGLNSMRTVATAAGVKPATVSRLGKELGFESYEQLREPFRQRLRKSEPEFSARMQDIQNRESDDDEALFAELRQQELDNISLYHLFENESREWSKNHHGSVVELHAYAVPEHLGEKELRRDLLDALHSLYPETQNARVLDERFIMAQDCPAFAPGSHAARPGVKTPFDGITLAGDFVKLPIPSALMERAVASGFLAANHLLAAHGVRPEPIRSIPRRGILGRRPSETEASRMR